jgi:hypothetical protein
MTRRPFAGDFELTPWQSAFPTYSGPELKDLGPAGLSIATYASIATRAGRLRGDQRTTPHRVYTQGSRIGPQRGSSKSPDNPGGPRARVSGRRESGSTARLCALICSRYASWHATRRRSQGVLDQQRRASISGQLARRSPREGGGHRPHHGRGAGGHRVFLQRNGTAIRSLIRTLPTSRPCERRMPQLRP